MFEKLNVFKVQKNSLLYEIIEVQRIIQNFQFFVENFENIDIFQTVIKFSKMQLQIQVFQQFFKNCKNIIGILYDKNFQNL